MEVQGIQHVTGTLALEQDCARSPMPSGFVYPLGSFLGRDKKINPLHSYLNSIYVVSVIKFVYFTIPHQRSYKTQPAATTLPRTVAVGTCFGLLELRASVGFPCIYLIVSNASLISFNF